MLREKRHLSPTANQKLSVNLAAGFSEEPLVWRQGAGQTRVATVFPNPESCLRLVSALLSEQDEEWLSGKIYLTMKPEITPK